MVDIVVDTQCSRLGKVRTKNWWIVVWSWRAVEKLNGFRIFVEKQPKIWRGLVLDVHICGASVEILRS